MGPGNITVLTIITTRDRLTRRSRSYQMKSQYPPLPFSLPQFLPLFFIHPHAAPLLSSALESTASEWLVLVEYPGCSLFFPSLSFVFLLV